VSVDMFMKIEGANGESKDSNHKDWTDIQSFSWGASQPGSMSSGGGGGQGKANFNDLHVVARIDKAAPAVMKHCASGKHLGKVELSVCKAGGEQVEYTKNHPGRSAGDFGSAQCRARCGKRNGQLLLPGRTRQTAVLGTVRPRQQRC